MQRLPRAVALAQVRAFLKDNVVPDYLVDEMFRRASDDAYWLSAERREESRLSVAVVQPVPAREMRVDEQIERDVYAGKRPLDDLTPMLKCRDRVAQAAARHARKLREQPLKSAAAAPIRSLMVPWNRLLPGSCPNDHAVPQQGARVL